MGEKHTGSKSSKRESPLGFFRGGPVPPDGPGEAERHSRKRFDQWKFPIWYLALMFVLLWVWQESFFELSVKTLPYSEFKAHVAKGEVTRVALGENEITGEIVRKSPDPSKNEAQGEEGSREPAPGRERLFFRTVPVEDPGLVAQLESAGVEYTGVRPSAFAEFLLTWILPIALMVCLWIFLFRRFAGGGQSMLSIGKSTARLLVDQRTGVTFGDVAGCDEAKSELQEVVDFLKTPKKYEQLGAKIPKGVLLVGPPGTGKTLLARAVAGEANVPFFSISGSDFVEMFVGVGAARVRDLFRQALSKAPCLIFIDEIDAIGRQRGVHVGSVNDEREQTLNQLLVEMDGFAANSGVILLAATNRPDVLDRALLRPGRFDRQILVDAPDVDGREAILRVHAREKPLAEDVDLRRIAQATPGFSGADLANTMNEAALRAARHNAREISQSDLEEALEKVVAGPERRSRRLSEEEKRRTAFHEAGHALVAVYSRHSNPVHKISIVPRGRAALGYTMQVPLGEQFLMTQSELLDRIRGLLGGRAAEEVIFGDASTGAENDLEHATTLARQMICLYGMSKQIGLTHCAQRPNPYLGHEGFQRDCSEETASEIDREVKAILERAHSEAKEILTAYRQELEVVTMELLQRETLDGPAFYRLLGKEVPADRAPGGMPAPGPLEETPSPAPAFQRQTGQQAERSDAGPYDG